MLLFPYFPNPYPSRPPLSTCSSSPFLFINFNKPKLLTWLCSSHSLLQSLVISHIRVSFCFFFWPSVPNCVTTISLSALYPCRLYAAGPHCRIFLCKSLQWLQWIIFLMQITGGAAAAHAGSGQQAAGEDTTTAWQSRWQRQRWQHLQQHVGTSGGMWGRGGQRQDCTMQHRGENSVSRVDAFVSLILIMVSTFHSFSFPFQLSSRLQ